MLIVGYTTKNHLLLDLDETSLNRAIALGKLLQNSYPELGDCLILESSTPTAKTYLKYDDKGVPHEKWTYQNFHMVFDRRIGYEKCVHIIDVLVDLDVLSPEYKEIRMFRGDMTLRTSPKWLHHRTIPQPKPAAYLGIGPIDMPVDALYNYVLFAQMCSFLFTADLNAKDASENSGKNSYDSTKERVVISTIDRKYLQHGQAN